MKNRDTIEISALRLLEYEGKYLKAGEILKYIITNYYLKRKNDYQITITITGLFLLSCLMTKFMT